jgi:hypothetical protein
MKRWVIVIALLLSPMLVQPAAAHARASTAESNAAALPAMCGDSAQTVLLSTGAPALSSAWQASPLAVPEAADDGQTAWCVSPDDPRCAPRDAGTPLQTQRSLLQLCDFASVRAPQPASIETDEVALLARLGAPRAGVSMRLERPPRA